MMAKRPISYAVLRGKVIETDLIEFGGHGGDITFLAPNPHKIADQIPVASPRLLEDLYSLSLEDIGLRGVQLHVEVQVDSLLED